VAEGPLRREASSFKEISTDSSKRLTAKYLYHPNAAHNFRAPEVGAFEATPIASTRARSDSFLDRVGVNHQSNGLIYVEIDVLLGGQAR
jgi:hypothetical protein